MSALLPWEARVFGLTIWQILIVVAIGFLIFGVGGTKKLARRAGDRIKDTGQGIKGAAGELQSSWNEEADPNSAAFRAAQTGRQTATQGAAVAVEAAKEARDGIAGMAGDAKSSAGGAEPQTAVGRAARAVGDSAREIAAGVVEDEGHTPQTKLGKAAQSVSETAKSRVGILGETASEFRAGIDGEPLPEDAPAVAPAPEAPGLPAGETPPPAQP